MGVFVVVIVLLAALAAWLIWRGIASAESQGAESHLAVPPGIPRTERESVTQLPGPGAEEAVPEPADRPDPDAQWDEVRGQWTVWHPVLARWVPWEDGPDGTDGEPADAGPDAGLDE